MPRTLSFLLWFVSAEHAAAGEPAPDELFDFGLEALEAGDVAGAQPFAVAIYDLGVEAFEADNMEGAVKLFSQARQLSPTNGTVLGALGDTYHDSGNAEAAIASYLEAVRVEPDEYIHYHNVGLSMSAESRLDEAQSYLRAAYARTRLGHVKELRSVCHDLGVVLANQRQPEEAEPFLRQAVNLEPHDLHAPLQLGRLLAVLGGREKEAAESLAETVQKAEEAASACTGRAEDPEEYREIRTVALADLEKLAENALHRFQDASSGVRTRDGRLVTRPGDNEADLPAEAVAELDNALPALQALVSGSPERGEMAFNLGQVFAYKGQHADAEATYRQAQKIGVPGEPHDLLFNMAVVIGKQARPSEAAALYRQAAKLAPEDTSTLENLGDALIRTGAREDAASSYRQATEIHAAQEAPYKLLINFDGDSDEFWERRVAEDAAAQVKGAAAAKAAKVSSAHPNQANLVPAAPAEADKLAAVIKRLRDTEVDPEWQVQRLLECADTFGASESTRFACAYGISWFDATWAKVVEHPLAARSHARVPADGSRSTPRVVVLGSALGEHCLFTSVLLGVPCVGYELLCHASVERATAFVPPGAPAEFRCKDALEADLSGASFVWLLDAVWPAELQEKLERKLAAELQENAVVALYRRPIWHGEGALKEHQDAVTVDVSWRRQLPVTLLEQRRSRPKSDEL